MLSTVAANSQGIIAVKAMHTSSFDCGDVVSTVASMFTYDVITMVTACAAAYCVSPAWQQRNKLRVKTQQLKAYSHARLDNTIQAVKTKKQICIPRLSKTIDCWAT